MRQACARRGCACQTRAPCAAHGSRSAVWRSALPAVSWMRICASWPNGANELADACAAVLLNGASWRLCASTVCQSRACGATQQKWASVNAGPVVQRCTHFYKCCAVTRLCCVAASHAHIHTMDRNKMPNTLPIFHAYDMAVCCGAMPVNCQRVTVWQLEPLGCHGNLPSVAMQRCSTGRQFVCNPAASDVHTRCTSCGLASIKPHTLTVSFELTLTHRPRPMYI